MQVEVDVKHMQTIFGGCGRFGFGDFAPFCLPSNLAKFSFGPCMVVKKLISGNWLKKFMQVEMDVKCMHTYFGGCGLFGFGDNNIFQKRPNFPFRPWTIIVHWSSKNLIDWNRLKKFMQVGVNVTCMHTNFGGHSLSGYGDIATFKNSQFSLSNQDYSPLSSEKLIDWNWLKKFMQVGIDVKCMHTNFGGHSFFNFGDIATFKNGQISLSDHGL